MPTNPNEDPGHPEVTGQPWPGDIADAKGEEAAPEPETKSAAENVAAAFSPQTS